MIKKKFKKPPVTFSHKYDVIKRQLSIQLQSKEPLCSEPNSIYLLGIEKKNKSKYNSILQSEHE